jgi:hypothetical protein
MQNLPDTLIQQLARLEGIEEMRLERGFQPDLLPVVRISRLSTVSSNSAHWA